MAKGRKILVPEARKGLDELKAKIVNAQTPSEAKFEVAKDQGIPLNEDYNGQLTSYQAGKIGGKLGGSMVKELVRMAKENLLK